LVYYFFVMLGKEILKGLEEYVAELQSSLKVIRFRLNVSIAKPLVKGGIFILPTSDNEAEVFIYPSLLSVKLANGLIIDFSPLAEKIKELLLQPISIPEEPPLESDEEKETQNNEEKETQNKVALEEGILLEENAKEKVTEPEKTQEKKVKKIKEVESFEEEKRAKPETETEPKAEEEKDFLDGLFD
jgi:hypothetical protein